ncbi:MAG: hypothetical protein U0176_17260 [Bacteroidia bacterium]
MPVGNPPQVFVTYPTACPAIIANCRTAIHVTFYNVARKDEISVYHNGLQVSPQYYDYNPGTGELVMNVDLTPATTASNSERARHLAKPAPPRCCVAQSSSSNCPP